MDDGRLRRIREEHSNKIYTINSSSAFQEMRRSCAEESSIEDERKSSSCEPSVDSSNLTWRLPKVQTLIENQAYLNEQLQHVVALSSMLELRSCGPENGTRKYLAREKDAADDLDRVCTLDLTKAWNLVTVETMQRTEEQKQAECELRNVMDLVSYLLYVRNRELDHQNRLSEKLSKVEKQLERKSSIVQTLTADIETLKQDLARKENLFLAKEKNFNAERRSAQTEKKALEIHCTRLQGVEAAYKAHLRRKDVEYARLKKTLQDVVVRASKEKRGMVIAKTLNGFRERKEALSDKASQENKLTRQILNNLERKKAELLLDNEALAKNYDSLQHHLESLTSQYKKAVRLFLAQKNLEGDAEELDKLASAPIDDFVPTPFNMATKDSIPNFISASMKALDEKLKQLEHVIRNELPSVEARSDKEIIKRLREKLDDAHTIINDQDQLLQASLAPHALMGKASERISQFEATHTESMNANAIGVRSSPNEYFDEELKQEKAELESIRQNLAKERQLLQEQALKLDKDRLEFEITKRDRYFETPGEATLPSHCEQTALSLIECPECSTPKRKRRAQHFNSDGPDSPFDLSVSATPDTAALLTKIGINVPTEK